jgi:ABC-type uncharacterized transport system fused permease/ATPase subunit
LSLGATHRYWRKSILRGFTEKLVFDTLMLPFCAWFILLPLYLRPKRMSFDLESNAKVMGEVYFNVGIFVQALEGAESIGELVDKWGQMSSNAKRIADLRRLLARLSGERAEQAALEMAEGEHIGFDDVDIVTPTGNTLVKGLTFRLEKGDATLITGHNGAGKSSIFRCLGGLWPIPRGMITKPRSTPVAGSGGRGGGDLSETLNSSIFYLPQKPYNVLGSLYDQLTYPDQGGSSLLGKERLVEILAMVDLAYLAEQRGALDSEVKLGLSPIVTSQYSSTTNTIFPIRFIRFFPELTIGFIPR